MIDNNDAQVLRDVVCGKKWFVNDVIRNAIRMAITEMKVSDAAIQDFKTYITQLGQQLKASEKSKAELKTRVAKLQDIIEQLKSLLGEVVGYYENPS